MFLGGPLECQKERIRPIIENIIKARRESKKGKGGGPRGGVRGMYEERGAGRVGRGRCRPPGGVEFLYKIGSFALCELKAVFLSIWVGRFLELIYRPTRTWL